MKKAISIFIVLIFIGTSTALLAQSHVKIKLNSSGESQISIQNDYGNIFLGDMSGDANAPSGILGKDNVFIGNESGKSNTKGSFNTFLGRSAGSAITTGIQNTFLGSYSGQYNTGSTNTFLGNQSGLFNVAGNGNIFLGYKAGQDETGSNKLYVENSNANSAGALIYGEFDTNYLRFNANVNINGAYTFPSTLGMSGQVLGINGSNQFGWTSISSLFDADADTGIGVEVNPDADKIVMYLENDVAMVLCENSSGNLLMDTPNVSIGDQAGLKSDHSDDVFIGNNAGKNVDSGSDNTFVGTDAGSSMTNSSSNTIIGADAGTMMSSGDGNTLVGSVAGMSSNGTSNTFVGISSGFSVTGNNNLALGNGAGGSSNGDNNVFLGSSAGDGSSSSNKLYIENTNADSTAALIYGEFDNDFLRLNANVNINGQYTLPSTLGTSGQVLGINGSSQFGWTSISSLIDTDADTGIKVEESTDEDVIRFDLEGAEYVAMKKNASGKLMIEPNNISIGIEAGTSSNSNDNVFIGHTTGVNQTGSSNTFIGNAAGSNGNAGNQNTYVGADAGKINTGLENTFIGVSSGEQATGDFNTFAGHSSGQSMNGDHNAIFGDEAGAEASGDYNLLMGPEAGRFTDGNANIFVGYQAGVNLDGNNNIALGVGAGENASGNYNVFLGQSAGTGSTGGDKLYIENTDADATEALIYGEFDNNKLRVNGDLGIGANALYPMHINSTDPRIKQADLSNAGVSYWASNNTWQVRFSGASNLESSGIYMTNTQFEPYNDDDLNLGSASYRWKEIFSVNGTINTSDRRFKKNINDLSYGLEEVMQMRPVSYQWKKETDGRIMNGFIAQEMEEIVPEVIHKTERIVDPNKPDTESEYDELYGMRYTELIPVLTKAIQELAKENQEQKNELEDLKSQIQEIKALLKND